MDPLGIGRFLARKIILNLASTLVLYGSCMCEAHLYNTYSRLELKLSLRNIRSWMYDCRLCPDSLHKLRHCCLSNLSWLGVNVSQVWPLQRRLAFFQMPLVPMFLFVSGMVNLDLMPNAFWLKNSLIHGSFNAGWNCWINKDYCIIVSILLGKVCKTTGAKLW